MKPWSQSWSYKLLSQRIGSREVVSCSSVKRHITSGRHYFYVSNICLCLLIPPLSHTHKFRRSEFLDKVTCISSRPGEFDFSPAFTEDLQCGRYCVWATAPGPVQSIWGKAPSEPETGKTRNKHVSTRYPNPAWNTQEGSLLLTLLSPSQTISSRISKEVKKRLFIGRPILWEALDFGSILLWHCI